MVRPTFLGIGVQRAATTWLHDCLSEHPEVYLPSEKELHYFNWHLDQGVEWYESQFDGHNGQPAIGEITPLYLHTAPLNVLAATCPDAKLIVILREPVDRAYSGFKLLEEQFFANMTFTEAMKSSRGQVVLEYSKYADKLAELFQHYPRSQVLIETYDDVCQSPQELFARVCRHIDVDPNFVPTRLGMISNRIIMPRMQKVLSSVGLGGLLELTKKSPIGAAIKRYSKRRQAQIDASPELIAFRKEVGAEFREDIMRCQELLGRDLSHWLAVK